MAESRIFLMGALEADDFADLPDFIAYYLKLGLAPSQIILAVRNDPDATATTLSKCGDVFDHFRIPRWTEIVPDDSVADWKQHEQDIHVEDDDWVVHADIGHYLRCPWSGDDLDIAARWMDAHQFDCVYADIFDRVAVGKVQSHPTRWGRYPYVRKTGEQQVAMARGYWYVCDDYDLCPQFHDSAWILRRPMAMHRFRDEVASPAEAESACWRAEALSIE